MKILLHICCANCAVYPAKILGKDGHTFTGFWFNPNIHPLQEYRLRLDSLKVLQDKLKFDIIYTDKYSPEDFSKIFNISHLSDNSPAPLLEKEVSQPPPEADKSGGLPAHGMAPKATRGFERCKSCYMLRLEKTAEQASKEGFDAFSTTLLISPYQDFEQITATGHHLADKYNVSFHIRDFRPYFRNSMAAAKEFGFYRQKYCGCIYSLEERRRTTKVTKPVSVTYESKREKAKRHNR